MDAIDRAATRFGMPMGPLALTDMVGLQTACFAGKVVAQAYPDRTASSPILLEMLKASPADKKTVLKFWTSGGKKTQQQPDPAVVAIVAKHRTGDRAMDEAEITDRLFLPMLVEATRVLEEGIVREPADVDMGLILGIGFPPFRGGILRWGDSQGTKAVVERLARYTSLGKRFEPTAMLVQMAQ